jgi:hypothetical protein
MDSRDESQPSHGFYPVKRARWMDRFYQLNWYYLPKNRQKVPIFGPKCHQLVESTYQIGTLYQEYRQKIPLSTNMLPDNTQEDITSRQIIPLTTFVFTKKYPFGTFLCFKRSVPERINHNQLEKESSPSSQRSINQQRNFLFQFYQFVLWYSIPFYNGTSEKEAARTRQNGLWSCEMQYRRVMHLCSNKY